MDVDWERKIAVTAYHWGMRVYNIENPAVPVLLSSTVLPLAIPAMLVELNWPYAYVATVNTVDTGSSHLFDLTDPAHPVELHPEFWMATPAECTVGSTVPPSAHVWNDYPCMSNRGGVWRDNTLYLSRSSVVERFDLTVTVDSSIFADGFESGTTGSWR